MIVLFRRNQGRVKVQLGLNWARKLPSGARGHPSLLAPVRVFKTIFFLVSQTPTQPTSPSSDNLIKILGASLYPCASQITDLFRSYTLSTERRPHENELLQRGYLRRGHIAIDPQPDKGPRWRKAGAQAARTGRNTQVDRRHL